jgi:hypothetical protein
MSGGLGYYCVYRAAHGMVLRLLCMMIDALRCAGVVYLPGMMNFLCISLFGLGGSLMFGIDREVSRDICMDLHEPSCR